MKLETIIEKLSAHKGNFQRYGSIYIAPENMKKLANFTDFSNEPGALFISPYLIDTEDDGGIYELLYYAFSLAVKDVSQSHYVEHLSENALPQEIIKNIYPKAIIAENDDVFFQAAVLNYLENMDNMRFEKDKDAHESLVRATLVYQIF